MKYKHIFLAILLSLPLLPSLLVTKEVVNQPLTDAQLLLIIPAVLEGLSFGFLYIFAGSGTRTHSPDEKKALTILSIGFFLLVGIPMLLMGIAGNTDTETHILAAFLLTFVYAFISLVVNTRRVIASSDKIKGYFHRRYMLPGYISLVLTLVLALTSPILINTVIAYYILKNFTLLQK